MKGLRDFRNSALKQHAVCIICLAMLFPAVCYSDDEAKSKLLKSAIEKASKSEKKDDSDDQDSNKKKKNEESRKNEERSRQSESSSSQGHHSMDSYRQTPAESHRQEESNSRTMGNIIRDAITSSRSGSQSAPVENHRRDESISNTTKNAIRDAIKSSRSGSQPAPAEDRWQDTFSSETTRKAIREAVTSNRSGSESREDGDDRDDRKDRKHRKHRKHPDHGTCYNCDDDSGDRRPEDEPGTGTDYPYEETRRIFNSRAFLERQVARIRYLLSGRWPGVARLSQAVFAAKQNCDDLSGTVHITYHDADNSTRLSVGDRFSFRYQYCRDNTLRITTDGQLALRVTELAGDVVNEIPPYTFSGRFYFDVLNVINNYTDERLTINGDTSFSSSDNLNISR